MPIDDRDYVRGEHPPSCTCKDCTDSRLIKWQNAAKSRKSGKPPKPPAMTRRGKPSGALLGCVLKLLVVFVLLIFGLVVWSLWGNQISSFITGLSVSPSSPVTKPLPQSPSPEIAKPTPATPESREQESEAAAIKAEQEKTEAEEVPKPIPRNKISDSFSFGLVKYNGLYISGSDGLVVLINNKNAKDPTYQELVNFLNNDKTDSFPYRLSPLLSSLIYGDPHDKVDKKYWLDIINGVKSPPSPNICADFAEMLHNNAEIFGIRAGYVCTEDHAFNVFETTDKGIVYIDDTGESIRPIPLYTPGSVTFGDIDSHDKVAYVEIGKPFGLISMGIAYLYGFDYQAYEKWETKKRLFDSKSDEYDRILSGRLIVSEGEYYELNRRMDELKALSDELGGFWEALDVVYDFEVIWDGE